MKLKVTLWFFDRGNEIDETKYKTHELGAGRIKPPKNEYSSTPSVRRVRRTRARRDISKRYRPRVSAAHGEESRRKKRHARTVLERRSRGRTARTGTWSYPPKPQRGCTGVVYATTTTSSTVAAATTTRRTHHQRRRRRRRRRDPRSVSSRQRCRRQYAHRVRTPLSIAPPNAVPSVTRSAPETAAAARVPYVTPTKTIRPCCTRRCCRRSALLLAEVARSRIPIAFFLASATGDFRL